MFVFGSVEEEENSTSFCISKFMYFERMVVLLLVFVHALALFGSETLALKLLAFLDFYYYIAMHIQVGTYILLIKLDS